MNKTILCNQRRKNGKHSAPACPSHQSKVIVKQKIFDSMGVHLSHGLSLEYEWEGEGNTPLDLEARAALERPE